ncbi:carboxylesterase [Stachybotrys elegans]|uniref:Carboxylic ester hydrolase n=1 Tax=Stachybotrys elegans TaxID=80388 RepID=A0A8K0T4F9_9HYPO|nr:carboxylesterase [Stachybotrys elegans]
MVSSTLLASLSLGLSALVQGRCDSKKPIVTVKNGTYYGIHNAELNQDFFLGMPFAKEPQRFALAVGLDSAWQGKRPATEYPRHCYGYGTDQIGYEESEDCLYINVIRPAATPQDAKLPVAVWIYGGGLTQGGSADRRYNMSFFVENSVAQGTPIIGVSFNYRLSVFGFLNGKEAEEAGVTNIGFRDQRLALRWINENINAFGGDKDAVTIFGESAGAESVTAQVFAYKGQHDGLFRSAAAQSGFGSMIWRQPGGFNATEAQQATYDTLVQRVPACAQLVGTSASLDCLRALPFRELNQALNYTGNGPGTWVPVLDGDFFVDYPHNQLIRGEFAKVPILIGTNTDEGAGSFGQRRGPNGTGINSDEDMRFALRSVFPPLAANTTGKTIEQLVDEVMYLYPNIQRVGIPSLERWPHVIQEGDEYANRLGLQFRRGASFFGDLWMQYARRRANLAWSTHGIKSYSYRFDVQYRYGGETNYGQVAFVFNNLNGNGYAINPFGGSDAEYIVPAKALSNTMNRAWINFFVSQDPNLDNTTDAAWPAYDAAASGGLGRNIVFDLDGAHSEWDDHRTEGINWFIENALAVFGS